jgi:hypothetical protein
MSLREAVIEAVMPDQESHRPIPKRAVSAPEVLNEALQ